MSQNSRSQARSAARLGAVQALYQQQMEGTRLAKLLDEFHQHRLGRQHTLEAALSREPAFVQGFEKRRKLVELCCTAANVESDMDTDML